MSRSRFARALPAAGLFVAVAAMAATFGPLPLGSWTVPKTKPILDKTLIVRLAPDLSRLDPAERKAVDRLLVAGSVMQNIHEEMLHRDARRVRGLIAGFDRPGAPEAQANLGRLYRLSSGPIATTLENRRLPFVATDSLVPGRNVYPWGVTKTEIEAYLARHPHESASILDVRTAVRRADATSLRADLTTLKKHPVLDVLHPGLADRLRARAARPDAKSFYAVPYAIAYADSLLKVYRLLNEAADAVRTRDASFAGYLRLRSRDLLANDYEGGDAAWVTARFGNLNAEVGAYETYDDELFGVKAWHGFNIMLCDVEATTKLRGAITGMQDIENSLPYGKHRRVREDIPVGIYDIVGDFGQSRGTNTASILPNESEHVRRYGRTILMRRNIITDPGIVAVARASFEAAIDPSQHGDFDPSGNFYRTLWHEIGHYLGPDRTADGRELDLALAEESGTFEEMKADLVSLFASRELRRRGYYDDRGLRAVHASGILRTLQKNKPRPDQQYPTMQLMQMNWYLDQGMLTYDVAKKKLTIHYEKYDAAVASLLKEVLAIQLAGDLAAANRFIERWTAWDERHLALAAAMRATETSRFRLVRYAALGE